MVRWVRMVRAQHPLRGRGQWVRLREARMKLCCDVRMLELWNCCCSGIDHFGLFVMERGSRRAVECIILCPARILVTVVHRSCDNCRILALMLCARQASLVHLAMFVHCELVPTGHRNDGSMHGGSVLGGLSPPRTLCERLGAWEGR